MKNIRCATFHFLLVVAPFAISGALRAATTTPLAEGWQLQSACKINAAGAEISQAAFSSSGWTSTQVPSTVVAAQTRAGDLPDPYFGTNLRQFPGMNYPIGSIFANMPMPDDSPYRCGWWYRKQFKAVVGAGQRIWLHFGGINYRADVWLNGKLVAGKNAVAGAYRTYDFDVTGLLQTDGENTLAVETFAPTEKDLGINWVDWNPCPPDKDMGLWGAVDLVTTGAVTVRSPMAVTHFPNDSLNFADITVYAELYNALDHPVTGVARGTVAGVRVEQTVTLGAHENHTVVFSPEQFPSLRMHQPKPWWPAQMGDPHLEQLTVAFHADGELPDEKTVSFGIREVTSEKTASGSKLFRINGKPLLIRGAGWSQDMLLRTDSNKLHNEIRLVKEMHLNTIRLEGKLETEEFFRLADEQGILVMLGWCCCDHWEHWAEWNQGDLEIATDSLRSQLLRLRHHASLLVWLNGSDNAPPANVERAYLDVEKDVHWPNPVLSAASQEVTSVTGEAGVKMTGPYDYVAPSYWYVDKAHGGAWGFNTETSPGPAIASRASRAKFLPDPDSWPPTVNWQYHNGSGKFAQLTAFDEAMGAVYAKPKSAAEYDRIASTMEYDSERAMFEAYSKNKYEATGVIQWMLNNAWPSMIWHLYDYYLDAGAGYFATRKACEPLHIQYSYDDRTIVVVNSTYATKDGLTATLNVHNRDWKQVFKQTAPVTAPADSSQRIFTLPESLYSGSDRLLLIDLSLTNAKGELVSRNFYWVPTTLTTFDWPATDYTHTPASRHEDLTALASLPKATVASSASVATVNGKRVIKVELANSTEALAFQLHAAVRTAKGELIAPVFWSDNWVELTPGESTVLTAEIPDDAANAVVELDGWNIQPSTIVPAAARQ